MAAKAAIHAFSPAHAVSEVSLYPQISQINAD
jgi:hypothetical protein